MQETNVSFRLIPKRSCQLTKRSRQFTARTRQLSGKTCWLTLFALGLVSLPTNVMGQVRMKAPDRGTYQYPQNSKTANSATTPSSGENAADGGSPQIAQLVRGSDRGIAKLVRSTNVVKQATPPTTTAPENADQTLYADKAKRLPLMNVEVENRSVPVNRMRQATAQSVPESTRRESTLQPVSHEEVVLLPPQVNQIDEPTSEVVLDPPVRFNRHRAVGHPLPQEAPQEPVEANGTNAANGADAAAETQRSTVPEVAPEEIAVPIEETIPMQDLHPMQSMHSVQPMPIAGCDSLGCDGMGCDGMGCDGMGCDGMGCGPMGCDTFGCDTLGCDSMPGSYGRYGRWSNSSISFRPERWFGNAELMLLWRRRDRLPPLVTTGPANDPALAGRLDQADTEILFPTGVVYQDMSVGGRFMLGTWLDNRQCRSLVLRGWFAGEESTDFSANQNDVQVIARPFFNVTDGLAPEQDTLLIAFPGQTQDGAVSVRGNSDVFGADIAVRQYWYGKYGATVDFLYGYQYMRLDEDLTIASTSFDPVLNATQLIDDAFDVENEFHGAQFGIATSYRECCWSFNALAKVAFGSVSRRSNLTGSTTTRVGAAESVDPNGLLVRGTNAGSYTDNTFGWVPEIDLTIGWQRWPCWEATFGYNIIAMTDAVRVSGVIDPELASNLADPPLGQQRPGVNRDDQTFYLQGIHFGIQYVH